jgi:hypothetical protein
MKKMGKYILVFIIGILIALLYFKKTKNKYENEQIQVVLNQIKNVSKLVVTEATFSEIYTHEQANKYLYGYISFDKKAILSVNAKVQVSYDLSKMVIVTDSINKKVIIKSLPKEEVFISPKISYYDFAQSTFNTFSKEELNKINEKSISQIKKTINLSKVKDSAKTQLLNELKKIYRITTLLDWELVDETETKIMETTLKKEAIFKD